MRFISQISVEGPPSKKAILTSTSDVDEQLELLHLRSVANWVQVALLFLYMCYFATAIPLVKSMVTWQAPNCLIFTICAAMYVAIWLVSKTYESKMQSLYWVKRNSNSSQSVQGQ